MNKKCLKCGYSTNIKFNDLSNKNDKIINNTNNIEKENSIKCQKCYYQNSKLNNLNYILIVVSLAIFSLLVLGISKFAEENKFFTYKVGSGESSNIIIKKMNIFSPKQYNRKLYKITLIIKKAKELYINKGKKIIKSFKEKELQKMDKITFYTYEDPNNFEIISRF